VDKWKLPPDGGHMDRATGIYLQTMTGKEVQERLRKNDLIIVPIGSTEAHGPHACSGEDTFLVTRMAEIIAQKTGCTVAEPIWYGSHPFHHLGMPGTIVVPEETFIAYLRAVIAGLWNAGFRKQILLNGHGQDYAIPVAMHQFAKKYQVPALLINVNWWFIIKEHIRDKAHGGPFETPFVHADECETSYSMALFPEMIKLEDAVDTKGESLMPPGHIGFSGSIGRFLSGSISEARLSRSLPRRRGWLAARRWLTQRKPSLAFTPSWTIWKSSLTTSWSVILRVCYRRWTRSRSVRRRRSKRS